MRTIHKYVLEHDDICLRLPRGAKILTVSNQGDSIYLWAEVDDQEQSPTPRYFRIFGTGHSIPEFQNLKYLGTVKLHGDRLIFHVYEVLSYE